LTCDDYRVRIAKLILFVEGENDCICLNYHGNSHGIYVVTAGGVSENILPKYKCLEKKYPDASIFVLYDNDNAGFNGMNHCESLGMKTIRQEFANDICDIHKASLMSKFLYWLKSFII
jgi:5S rRNA maturation endonuclease (ribonuclease M5)